MQVRPDHAINSELLLSALMLRLVVTSLLVLHPGATASRLATTAPALHCAAGAPLLLDAAVRPDALHDVRAAAAGDGGVDHQHSRHSRRQGACRLPSC